MHGRQSNGDANWISALTCLVNTDLLATGKHIIPTLFKIFNKVYILLSIKGSCDGYIRLWQTYENSKKLKEILQIPVKGFINGLAFNADGSKLYAAVGQEHRWGRWWRLPEAKNAIVVINLQRATKEDES